MRKLVLLRHDGALQGLNKAETAKRFGGQQVSVWRRSYDISKVEIPTGMPLVYELGDKMEPLKRYYLGEASETLKAQNWIGKGVLLRENSLGHGAE